jgi:hypothetical protein
MQYVLPAYAATEKYVGTLEGEVLKAQAMNLAKGDSLYVIIESLKVCPAPHVCMHANQPRTHVCSCLVQTIAAVKSPDTLAASLSRHYDGMMLTVIHKVRTYVRCFSFVTTQHAYCDARAIRYPHTRTHIHTSTHPYLSLTCIIIIITQRSCSEAPRSTALCMRSRSSVASLPCSRMYVGVHVACS